MKPEAQLQRTITDWLSAEKYWWRRRNAGTMFIEGRKIGYGVAGDADLEVLYRNRYMELVAVFIEVKSPKGKQSPNQKTFQSEVEALGCFYVLAYSLEDVQRTMGVLKGD